MPRLFLKVAVVTLVYLVTFILWKGLQFPLIWDEHHYWPTSLFFSERLVPTVEQLRTYEELSTPLPFLMFGYLEYFFNGGIFAGRLLNFILSFVMICLIIIPNRKGNYPILCTFGLLLCPYYLFKSILLYTDIIATFFVFLGFWFYTRNRHVYSSICFILAIASRQYMLAFPVAVAVFELSAYWKHKSQQSIRWVAPMVAAASILGWIWFFGGLVPPGIVSLQNTLENKLIEVDQNGLELFGIWFFPAHGLYFLACIGLYFVIPELILFRKQRKKFNLRNLVTRTNGWIALLLLFLFAIYPPVYTHGLLKKIVAVFPSSFLQFTLLYMVVKQKSVGRV